MSRDTQRIYDIVQVFRQISASGQTLSYEGILVKEDMDWTAMEKEVTIRKNAVSLALFAVGVRMPEGATALVNDVTIEEMR